MKNKKGELFICPNQRSYLNKRGQMKLSFGMIFSIILIIVFIAFAFIAIRNFLKLQDSIKTEQFVNNLQDNVDKMWQSSQGSQKVEYALPSKIKSVCFVDKGYENLVFNSNTFVEGEEIKHINITKITEEGDFCVENIDGKVKMIIQKDYEDSLVMITKQ